MTGNDLRERRKKLNLNQTEFAEALGVTQNTVSRWELGTMAIPPYLELALKQIEQEKEGKPA